MKIKKAKIQDLTGKLDISAQKGIHEGGVFHSYVMENFSLGLLSKLAIERVGSRVFLIRE